MDASFGKSQTFPLSKAPYPKNPYTGLPDYPPKSPFSFNLPLHLMLDIQERNYIDNIWANNRNSIFPKILTSFCDYLHNKNLKIQINDPTLKPKSLDAFLELQQTNQVLAGEVADLQQKLGKLKKEYEKTKNENEILKKQWEKELEEKEKTFEKFPRQISSVQGVVMEMVFTEKQQKQFQIIEMLQDMAFSVETKTKGLSFCMTRYKGPDHPDIQACICKEGFSIIQATINLAEWEQTSMINQKTPVDLLFELGMIKKLIITEEKQMRTLLQFPPRLKTIISSMMEVYPKHFVVLDIMSIPPFFRGYPVYAQHYIRIDMVHYGRPKVYQWNHQAFSQNSINISTEERLKRWRAYALGVAPKKHKANYLLGEQDNLKIFSSVTSRSYKSPMQGTIITAPELTDHLKKCNACWFESTLGDDKIFISELNDDDDILDYAVGAYDAADLALDDIGEANLINAMEG